MPKVYIDPATGLPRKPWSALDGVWSTDGDNWTVVTLVDQPPNQIPVASAGPTAMAPPALDHSFPSVAASISPSDPAPLIALQAFALPSAAVAAASVGPLKPSSAFIDLDADNSTTGGRNYRSSVFDGGPPVPVADADVQITDADGNTLESAIVKIKSPNPGDLLTVIGTLPAGISARPTIRRLAFSH
jgi:hypothetical protein